MERPRETGRLKWAIAGAARSTAARASELFEQYSLGICLVGDFQSVAQPTRAQLLMESENSFRYLRERCGKDRQGRDSCCATP